MPDRLSWRHYLPADLVGAFIVGDQHVQSGLGYRFNGGRLVDVVCQNRQTTYEAFPRDGHRFQLLSKLRQALSVVMHCHSSADLPAHGNELLNEAYAVAW
jgi:hypothetical protein